MKAKNWIVSIEHTCEVSLLKNILVWNYDMGNYIEVIYHYISYKNADKRGIGQWNVKLKNQ